MPKRKKEEDEPVVPPITVKGGLKELGRFLGEWVAINDRREICAHGTVSGDVLRAAWAAGVEKPELLFVPDRAIVG